MSEDTNAVRIQTQSGEAIIDIAEIVAVVKCNSRFLKNEHDSLVHENGRFILVFDVDVHTRSGTIFTAEDKTEEFFDVIRGFMCPDESTYLVE